MKHHHFWMLIACVAPLLLIFFLPVLGAGSGESLFLFLILCFGIHLLMMRGHGHGQNGQIEGDDPHDDD